MGKPDFFNLDSSPLRRLRNVKNKLANATEALGFSK